MSIASELAGQTFTVTIYESVVGKIQIENLILKDGSVYTTIWVVFPDGFADEVNTVKQAEEALEL